MKKNSVGQLFPLLNKVILILSYRGDFIEAF